MYETKARRRNRFALWRFLDIKLTVFPDGLDSGSNNSKSKLTNYALSNNLTFEECIAANDCFINRDGGKGVFFAEKVRKNYFKQGLEMGKEFLITRSRFFSRESRISHFFHGYSESHFLFPKKFIKKDNFCNN